MNLNLEKINGYSVINIQEERIDAHNSGELKAYILKLIEMSLILLSNWRMSVLLIVLV